MAENFIVYLYYYYIREFVQNTVCIRKEADNAKNLLTHVEKVLRRISHITTLKLGFCSSSNSNAMSCLIKNMKNIVVDLVDCDMFSIVSMLHV